MFSIKKLDVKVEGSDPKTKISPADPDQVDSKEMQRIVPSMISSVVLTTKFIGISFKFSLLLILKILF